MFRFAELLFIQLCTKDVRSIALSSSFLDVFDLGQTRASFVKKASRAHKGDCRRHFGIFFENPDDFSETYAFLAKRNGPTDFWFYEGNGEKMWKILQRIRNGRTVDCLDVPNESRSGALMFRSWRRLQPGITKGVAMSCQFFRRLVLPCGVSFVVVIGAIGAMEELVWSGCGGSLSDDVRNQAREISMSVWHYKLKYGEFPTNTEGLNVLVSTPITTPSTTTSPTRTTKKALLQRVIFDPWGLPFGYRNPGSHNTFDVLSAGPDRIFGTLDDIGNWAD